jgi:hypothetical protein
MSWRKSTTKLCIVGRCSASPGPYARDKQTEPKIYWVSFESDPMTLKAIQLRFGNGSNLLFRMNIKTELYFIDHQTNNGIMHIIFLRKAKGSSCQPFNPRSQI